MAIFQSDQQLYDILQLVFAEVTRNPTHIETFTQSNLVIRLRTQQPEAEVLLDGRQPPLEVFYGVRPGKANLEIAMTADLLHAIWTSAVSAHEAFFSGQIKTRGNLLKAAALLDLFYACEQVYPPIAAAHGLGA
ncbi:MAG: hypothetical protein R3C14_22100 [Caldilineaceae bacterium]